MTASSLNNAEAMEVRLSRHGALNKMTPPKLLFCLTCLLLGEAAQAADARSSVLADAGAEVTLRCTYEGHAGRIYWFKQSLGQKPRLICSSYKFKGNGTFYNEFEKNPRFTLDTENKKNNLKIVDLRLEDSATYYCASAYVFAFEFEEGTTVTVRGSGYSIRASVLQSGPWTAPPGRSVTLNCTARTERCNGEHAISWFKSSGAPHPGIIYTRGGGKDRCERDADTQTRACVFDLPLNNLTRAHAGTYYCAVSLCGYIAFGNGTKLSVEDKAGRPPLVYFLSGALALTAVASVVSTLCLYQVKRNKTRDHRVRFSADPPRSQDEDSLHYAAIRTNKTHRPRKERRSSNDECVYSTVKQ